MKPKSISRWMVLFTTLFIGLAFSSSPVIGAEKDSMEKLREELESLKKDHEKLKRDFEKKDFGDLKESTPTLPTAGKKGKVGSSQWFEIRLGQTKMQFYGFVRFDAIYDDSRMNNNQVPGFVLSEDRTSSTFRGKDEDDLTFHTRLTRLGFLFDGPKLKGLGQAKVNGKIEIDFYNGGTSNTDSRAPLRMRHAFVQLNWETVSITAGQREDLISPLYPIVNNDLVMWGAGNLADRRPQLRFEFKPKFGKNQLFLQTAIGLTGALDQQAGSTNTGSLLDGEISALPTIQARVAFRVPMTKSKNLEIGVWGHRAWEDPDTTGHFKSWVYGVDLYIPLGDRFWIKAEIWHGSNVDDVRGGIFQGIVNGDEVVSRGGWIELGFKVTDTYSVSIGYATDDPDNSDLASGGRALNRTAYLANRFVFGPVGIGLDFLHWRTEFVGFDKGTSNRVNAFIYFKF